MSQKTPVSILQEFMMRHGHTPQYELVVDGTGTHDPIFKYKVSTPEVSAIGIGKSKKEAKHEAAKNALVRLKQSTDKPDPIVNVAEIESPYKDKTQENSIGLLIDMCAIRNLPQPEFYLISDDGPPHAKMFTMSCRVSKLQKIAVGRTKKQAKQLAAQKLLTKLKESVGELPVSSESITSKNQIPEEELQKKLNLLVKSPFASNYKSCGNRLSDEIHLLSGLTCETLDKIRENELKIDKEAESLVESIAKELNVELKTCFLPANNESDKEIMHFAVMVMDLDIAVAQHGMGHTQEEAKQNAAASLIKTLIVLTERRGSK